MGTPFRSSSPNRTSSTPSSTRRFRGRRHRVEAGRNPSGATAELFRLRTVRSGRSPRRREEEQRTSHPAFDRQPRAAARRRRRQGQQAVLLDHSFEVSKSFGRKYVEFTSAPGNVTLALYGRRALARMPGCLRKAPDRTGSPSPVLPNPSRIPMVSPGKAPIPDTRIASREQARQTQDIRRILSKLCHQWSSGFESRG